MAEPSEARAYEEDVRAHHLEPLWNIADWFLPAAPFVTYGPYHWRWEDVKPRLLAAAQEMQPGQGGDRRVLVYAHPELTSVLGTTHTLNAAIQLILPGEVAPAHRHTPLAVRFIIAGEGAYTTVNGEEVSMNSGDFLVTPRMAWHDHGHRGDGPMVWLDGLDIPITRTLGSTFVEPYPDRKQRARHANDYSWKRWGRAGLLPRGTEQPDSDVTPLLMYKWRDMRAVLDAARDTGPDPFDGAAVTYTHPTTGGSPLPTLAAMMQSLLPGEATASHRHTSSQIYYVYRGQGETTMDAETIEWAEGDVFVLPPWRRHHHRNTGTGEALLFSISDEPLLKRLGLYREEPT